MFEVPPFPHKFQCSHPPYSRSVRYFDSLCRNVGFMFAPGNIHAYVLKSGLKTLCVSDIAFSYSYHYGKPVRTCKYEESQPTVSGLVGVHISVPDAVVYTPDMQETLIFGVSQFPDSRYMRYVNLLASRPSPEKAQSYFSDYISERFGQVVNHFAAQNLVHKRQTWHNSAVREYIKTIAIELQIMCTVFSLENPVWKSSYGPLIDCHSGIDSVSGIVDDIFISDYVKWHAMYHGHYQTDEFRRGEPPRRIISLLTGNNCLLTDWYRELWHYVWDESEPEDGSIPYTLEDFYRTS